VNPDMIHTNCRFYKKYQSIIAFSRTWANSNNFTFRKPEKINTKPTRNIKTRKNIENNPGLH
jgi:hypothetical protein